GNRHVVGGTSRGGCAHRGDRATTTAGRPGDGGELHAVVVPAAHVLARHAGTSCGAVVARRAGRAAAARVTSQAPTDKIGGFVVDPEAFGFFLRVLDAAAAAAALCVSNECHEMSFLGCGSIGVPVGDAATPGPAGVKVPLCYHVLSPKPDPGHRSRAPCRNGCRRYLSTSPRCRCPPARPAPDGRG